MPSSETRRRRREAADEREEQQLEGGGRGINAPSPINRDVRITFQSSNRIGSMESYTTNSTFRLAFVSTFVLFSLWFLYRKLM